ncbi:MAG: G-D-S-L family lipolytic protein [Symploca sp. SIO2E9]|nr:G-D-S-L family lipolytic protein [Symploca sp. SIO2E9]
MQTFVASSVKQFCPRQQQPLKLVVMGDSIIYGFGDPEGGGWVERLRRQWMLPDTPGHVIYNLGVRGDGVKQVHQRFEHEFRSRGELRNRLPDAIIFSVGVNDSARLGRPDGRNFTDFDSFQTQLGSLLDQAQRLCPVLFVGMAPVDETKMPFMDCLYYNHADQHRYKEATRLACLKRQIPYLDIFEIWKSRGADWWSKQILKDGLHPNVSGYKALLQEVITWESINNLETLSLAAA